MTTSMCINCHTEQPFDNFRIVGKKGRVQICDDCRALNPGYLTAEQRINARLWSHRKYNRTRRALGAPW